MHSMIKVFSHLSPDTDATGCAILWAWYSNSRGEEAQPFVLGSLNKETQFVLSRWGVPQPELLSRIGAGENVVIVDTNNPQELFSNINEANILNIIDHHRFWGGLQTVSPVEVTIRTLASTASVIHDLMGETAEKLPRDMAGIMLSCILSDTLAFRSPTTTTHDKDIAEKLAKQLGLDMYEYANEMFSAKSDVSDYTDEGLLHVDSKKFPVGDKMIRVSVVETTNPAEIVARKSGIVSAIREVLKVEKDTDDILFFIVDIFKEEATVLTYNEFTKGLVEASFGTIVEGDTKVLPGVLSRKKQIVPALRLP